MTDLLTAEHMSMLEKFYSAIEMSTRPDGFLCLPEQHIKSGYKELIQDNYKKWNVDLVAELNLSNLIREFNESNEHMYEDLIRTMYNMMIQALLMAACGFHLPVFGHTIAGNMCSSLMLLCIPKIFVPVKYLNLHQRYKKYISNYMALLEQRIADTQEEEKKSKYKKLQSTYKVFYEHCFDEYCLLFIDMLDLLQKSEDASDKNVLVHELKSQEDILLFNKLTHFTTKHSAWVLSHFCKEELRKCPNHPLFKDVALSTPHLWMAYRVAQSMDLKGERTKGQQYESFWIKKFGNVDDYECEVENVERFRTVFAPVEYEAIDELTIFYKYVGKNLDDYLKENCDQISAVSAKAIITQVCDLISILHTKGYVHLDLKPPNIAIFDEKITILDAESVSIVINNKASIKVSTEAYAAPEMIGSKAYGTYQSDVWQLCNTFKMILKAYLPSQVVDYFDEIMSKSDPNERPLCETFKQTVLSKIDDVTE